MSAIDKTKKLVRKDVPIHLIDPNEENPNAMDTATFNMLYDNIEQVGFIDPLFVIPSPTEDGRYKLIGGEHRWEVAKLLEFKKVPCTIVNDEDFDEDLQRFQIVRMNIIHGKMTPDKFVSLVNNLTDKYSEEVFSEMFGFTDEAEFNKLLNSTQRSLPKEMQEDFKAAKAEIKTIDDLSLVLNKLFTAHGDTLPYGYMIIEFGGKDSVWLRMKQTDFNNFGVVANNAKEFGVTVDSLMSTLLKSLAEGGSIPSITHLIEQSEAVDVGDFDGELMTLDFLEN